MDNIIIYTKGLNGSKTFSIFNANSNEPIITNKELKEISKNFVRMYPDAAQKIKKHLQDWSDLPKEVNLNHLDGGDRMGLIEKISSDFELSCKK
jgi:predicted nucleic acid-binding protein